MPPFDQVHRAELHSAIEYELYALDEFRFRVHLHRDAAVTQVSHTLGRFMPDGTPMINQTVIAESISGSESAVRTALQPLRPLLFGATFKVQDLIVEWLLRANGVSPAGVHWPMNQKPPALRVATTLPPEVVSLTPIWKAFVETYAKLIEPRHVVVHRKGVRVHANGDIELATTPHATVITDSMQGALVQSTSILAHAFGGTRVLDAAAVIRLENALSQLASLHGVTGLSSRTPRPTSMTIDVPASLVTSRSPLECSVDFDDIAKTWKRLEQLFTTSVVIGNIVVHPDGAPIGWAFDPDTLPAGVVVLTEGDPAFDSFVVAI